MSAGHTPGRGRRTRGVDWWRFLPAYWLQNTPTDREWDALLNDALDQHCPVEGYFTARIGPLEVWVSNWPYQYGHYYGPGTQTRGLPMVRTRKRLRRLLRQDDYSAARAALARVRGETPEGEKA